MLIDASSFLVFAAAALLLAIERCSYVAVWRRPDRFRTLLMRPPAAALLGSDPVGAMLRLFLTFKAIQLGVFAGWCLWFGAGRVWPPAAEPAVLVLAGALIAVGQVLNAGVFWRLGRVGVFYGERFGHALEWVRGFPFSVVQHPQYLGTVLSIWGLFLALRFPNPDWMALPLLEAVYYAAGAHFERMPRNGAPEGDVGDVSPALASAALRSDET